MKASEEKIHPLVMLMRRFVVDWLDRSDPHACEAIMSPHYIAAVGGVRLVGRDDYVAATVEQLQQFPGLLLTVHELFTSGEQVALRFTEHGGTADRGRAAAWTGIGIFTWDGSVLTANVTEEDYLARRRQLKTGQVDSVASPLVAPWAVMPEPPDRNAEDAVRRWLMDRHEAGDPRVQLDDAWTGQPTPALIDMETVEIDTLFSAGRRVAFHATVCGTYQGGLDVPPLPAATKLSLRFCGTVLVDEAGALSGHIVRDRAGLRRELIELAGGAR